MRRDGSREHREVAQAAQICSWAGRSRERGMRASIGIAIIAIASCALVMTTRLMQPKWFLGTLNSPMTTLSRAESPKSAS
jgi:hypothetical protein